MPGNHDCDFARANSVRSHLLKEAVRGADGDVVRECLGVQAPFVEFADTNGFGRPPESEVVGMHTATVANQKVKFFMYNSAWMSSMVEHSGTLRAPVPLIEAGCRDGSDSADPCLVIWMMHHPYAWFDANDAKALRRYVETVADVVLTGHEHDGGAHTRSYRTGLQVDYVEGGVLQESSDSHSSSFNLIVVDTESLRQRVVHFSRENELYVADGPELWQGLVRNRTRVARLLDHNDHFAGQLDDVGVSLNHPRLARVRLRDVFVYPDVRDLPLGNARERSLVRDVPGFVAAKRKLVLIGPEKSGKSSIAKCLCQDLRRYDLVTLLVDGGSFAPRGFERLRTAMKGLIAHQLSATAVDAVMQLKAEHRCIIIDNYHLIKLPRAGRAQLLKELESYFGVIVLLASEDIRLEYLSQAPDVTGTHPIFDYAHAEILQLGHVRRHEMVARWCWLGRDRGEVDEDLVHREVLEAETLLSGVIGKNLIPSFPVFVLILLHQHEAGRAQDTGAGSQGYLYQSLIEASLRRIAPHPHDIDSRFAYLTELAWCGTERGGSAESSGEGLSRSELRRWHQQYRERQLVDFEYPKYVDDLVGVGILRWSADRIGFSYPYIRYFFEARYLRSHLHEPAIRDLVRGFAGRLHDERVATVMVFLVHLSPDPFVLDTMLESARGLFAEYPEWDTATHTGFLNTLVQQTPRLALLQTSLEQNRVSELQALDDSEDVGSADEEEATDGDESSVDFEREIEPILKVNSALKTIQIVGQILRNYPGSLDGPRKVALAEVCYRLGLRMLGYTYSSIESHGEEFVRGLVAHVVRLRPEARRNRITVDANAFLFALCERFSFGIVRHISQSLGHQELAPVFREIERIGEGKTPFRVIDLSIKLDHSRQPPADEAVRLHGDEKSNTIVATLIRHLVWYHLYLFPTDYRTRQQLCSKLEIDDTPGLITNTSKLIPAKPRS